jgi:hypothetical protein
MKKEFNEYTDGQLGRNGLQRARFTRNTLTVNRFKLTRVQGICDASSKTAKGTGEKRGDYNKETADKLLKPSC